MAEALIKFERYTTETKSSLQFLVSQLPSGRMLEGDWINDPMTLNDAFWRMQQAIEDLQKHPKYKYANPCKVVRTDDSVYIVSTGVSTDKERKICGYIKLKPQQ